jgi:acyl transferase domain-containing protein
MASARDALVDVLKTVTFSKPRVPVYSNVTGRGSHSFTSQLNFSAFYGIGGARDGHVARVNGALGAYYGV